MAGRAAEGRKEVGSRGRLRREVGTGPGKREEGGGVERRWQPVQQQQQISSLSLSLALAGTHSLASNSRSRDGQRGRAGQLTLLAAPPSEAYGILALPAPSLSSHVLASPSPLGA